MQPRSVGLKVANVDELTGWERLGAAIVHRRVQLGFYRRTKAFAARAGFSDQTLTNLEQAKKEQYDPGTFAKLEQALLWRPGSAQAVVGGLEPDELPIPVPTEPTLSEIDDVELVTRFSELHAEMTRRLLTRSRVDPSSLPTVPTGEPVPWDETGEAGQSSA